MNLEWKENFYISKMFFSCMFNFPIAAFQLDFEANFSPEMHVNIVGIGGGTGHLMVLWQRLISLQLVYCYRTDSLSWMDHPPLCSSQLMKHLSIMSLTLTICFEINIALFWSLQLAVWAFLLFLLI